MRPREPFLKKGLVGYVMTITIFSWIRGVNDN